jgi:hypothetical protein
MSLVVPACLLKNISCLCHLAMRNPQSGGIGRGTALLPLPSGSKPCGLVGQAASRTLVRLLVEAFVPDGPLVLGIDETLERRRGKKIRARGIYRYLRFVPTMATSSRRAPCAGCA